MYNRICFDWSSQSTLVVVTLENVQSIIKQLFFMFYNTVIQKKHEPFHVVFKSILNSHLCKITKMFYIPAGVLRRGPQNFLTPKVISFQLRPSGPYFEFLTNTLVWLGLNLKLALPYMEFVTKIVKSSTQLKIEKFRERFRTFKTASKSKIETTDLFLETIVII